MAFLGHLHVDDIAGDDEWHEDYLIVDVGHTFPSAATASIPTFS